jgi:O-antigen ligase
MSRMGVFSFAATALFLTLAMLLRKTDRGVALGLGLGLIALITCAALWLGVDSLVQRYADVTGQDAILREGRILIFRDVIRMIAANPMGVGTGNFQDRVRVYQDYRPDLVLDHAHNDYLETTAEWGLPLASAFWSVMFFVVVRGLRAFRSIRSPEQQGILLACVGAMFSILVHSLADFNLQIPSNRLLFFVFVGISMAFPLPERSRTKGLAAGG